MRSRRPITLLSTLFALLLLASTVGSQELSLAELERRIQAGARTAKPRTVLVRSSTDGQNRSFRFGSGAIIATRGLILTCAHVLTEQSSVEVVTHDGRILGASILGVHPTADLALLQVEADNLIPFRIDASPPQPGDWALALGHPIGPSINLAPSMAAGRIRAVGRNLPGPDSRHYRNMIWSDIPVEAGASGGPLASLDGQYLLGINAVVDTDHVRTFSIPIDQFRKLLPDLARGGTISTRITPGTGVDPPRPGRQAVLEPALVQALETVTPWTVRILARTKTLAHGVIVRPEGLVVTASERIPEQTPLRIQTAGGHTRTATVMARDREFGLALLRVDSQTRFPVPPDFPEPAVSTGTLLVSPGPRNSLLGVGFLSTGPRPVFEPFLRRILSETTAARLSKPRSLLGPILQHDTPLDLSHLGGPLVDRAGRLVGVNVSTPIRGVTLAIPTALLRERVLLLARGRDLEPSAPGYLGIHLETLPTPQRKALRLSGGILVTGVLPGFPAARAGLEEGDVILRIGDRSTSLPEQLIGWLLAHPPSTKATLIVHRGQELLTFSLVLEERP